LTRHIGEPAWKNITFAFPQSHTYGPAYFDFLALRKRFFVDTLGWDIPHDARYEMDQYDNPTAYYSLVLKDGSVVGGARAQPTTAAWGDHTYMLRDALRGKLSSIPPEVMGADIVDSKVWECTRLVIDDSVATHADRSTCLRLIVQGLIDTAAGKGAEQLISLSPLALMRALRQLGFGAQRLGSPYLNDGDGRRYAVLTMPTPPAGRVAPTTTHRLLQPEVVHAPAV